MRANKYRFTPKTIVIAKLVLRYLKAQCEMWSLLSCEAYYHDAYTNADIHAKYEAMYHAYDIAIALYERSHAKHK
jgi:hypothetical protein